MLHPLFSTVIQRPDLVMDHVSAYASLIHQEASAAGADLRTRLMAWLVALLAGVVFLALTGVAVMFGVMQNQFHWVLVAVPGVALLMTLFALMLARQSASEDRFSELKAQLESDARALRTLA